MLLIASDWKNTGRPVRSSDMVTFKHKGNFRNLELILNKDTRYTLPRILEQYAKEGKMALIDATPTRSGETAMSWDYEITNNKAGFTITWTNSNLAGNVPVALLLQYGHGTGTGGYVQGYDYINPALQKIFDKLADDLWKEVTR